MLVDSSFLVAAFDRDSVRHQQANEIIAGFRSQLIVPEVVLTEVVYLLKRDGGVRGAVPRHGGRRRRLAARIDRGFGFHHLRAEHRGGNFKGSLGRGVRRASVPRHLPGAARRKAGRDRCPATDRQT